MLVTATWQALWGYCKVEGKGGKKTKTKKKTDALESSSGGGGFATRLLALALARNQIATYYSLRTLDDFETRRIDT